MTRACTTSLTSSVRTDVSLSSQVQLMKTVAKERIAGQSTIITADQFLIASTTIRLYTLSITGVELARKWQEHSVANLAIGNAANQANHALRSCPTSAATTTLLEYLHQHQRTLLHHPRAHQLKPQPCPSLLLAQSYQALSNQLL